MKVRIAIEKTGTDAAGEKKRRYITTEVDNVPIDGQGLSNIVRGLEAALSSQLNDMAVVEHNIERMIDDEEKKESKGKDPSLERLRQLMALVEIDMEQFPGYLKSNFGKDSLEKLDIDELDTLGGMLESWAKERGLIPI